MCHRTVILDFKPKKDSSQRWKRSEDVQMVAQERQPVGWLVRLLGAGHVLADGVTVPFLDTSARVHGSVDRLRWHRREHSQVIAIEEFDPGNRCI